MNQSLTAAEARIIQSQNKEYTHQAIMGKIFEFIISNAKTNDNEIWWRSHLSERAELELMALGYNVKHDPTPYGNSKTETVERWIISW